MILEVDPDWWKTLFDEVYLLTDARSVCNDEVTRREIDVVCELAGLAPEHRVLDFCGGHGRHSLELSRRGFANVTVFDFSERLLEHGGKCARECGRQVDFVQGDARASGLPDGAFDRVLIMGNSLGYLPEDDADHQILAEAFRVLAPGGRLLVDVADGEYARSCLTPEAWHEIEPEVVVCRRRELRENRIAARELVLSKTKGLIRDRAYSIRLYRPDDLGDLITSAGFINVELHTDFLPKDREGDYGCMNHRVIVTGEKVR